MATAITLVIVTDKVPERSDPQFAFPKATAATAALAQAISSPRFRRAFPEAAARQLRCVCPEYNALKPASAAAIQVD